MEKLPVQVTKSDIEKAINNKDDFVKLDYLNRYLNQVDNFDLKKFILLNLATIHESKNMLQAAIRNITSAADIAISYKEKIELYTRIIELYIKMRNFPMAENALKQAMYFAPEVARLRLKESYVNIFWCVAKDFESKDKLRQAIEVYEYMLSINMPDEQREELKLKLLDYYDKRGMTREYNKLKSAR